MSQYFTRTGGFVFVLAQVMKGITALMLLLIAAEFIPLVDFGWINGNDRSSALLPTALAAIVVATLAVAASVARPSGPGTGKWYFNDGFYTIVLAVIVGVALVIMMNRDTLTGLRLDALIVVGTLVVVMLLWWFAADHLEMAAVSTPPRLPAAPEPVIDSFTSNVSTIPAGGTVVLNWLTRNGVDADISGHGVAGLQGPTSYRPAGASGTTATIVLTVRGAAGTTPATRSITVALT